MTALRPLAAGAGEDPETRNAMLSPRQQARLRREVAAVMHRFVSARPGFPASSPEAVEAAFADFMAAYERRPVSDNEGGSRFNVCAWLFVLARLLAPRQVIESGTHRGQTAWLFRQACPDVPVTTFDVSHQALAHRHPGVTYVRGDWMETDISDNGAGLAFFDDHVSQARRVREAQARGFRWLLFDDNLAAHQLFATGAPPVPTVAMLFDDELHPGERIEWRRKGRHHVHVIDAEAMAEARALIADWAVAPELLPITCYRGQFGLTLVRLAG